MLENEILKCDSDKTRQEDKTRRQDKTKQGQRLDKDRTRQDMWREICVLFAKLRYNGLRFGVKVFCTFQKSFFGGKCQRVGVRIRLELGLSYRL